MRAGAYRGMLNYTPKQHGARQRLMTPLRASKLADARERRRARLRARKEDKAVAKQQRKQLVRGTLPIFRHSPPYCGSTSTAGCGT